MNTFFRRKSADITNNEIISRKTELVANVGTGASAGEPGGVDAVVNHRRRPAEAGKLADAMAHGDKMIHVALAVSDQFASIRAIAMSDVNAKLGAMAIKDLIERKAPAEQDVGVINGSRNALSVVPFDGNRQRFSQSRVDGVWHDNDGSQNANSRRVEKAEKLDQPLFRASSCKTGADVNDFKRFLMAVGWVRR